MNCLDFPTNSRRPLTLGQTIEAVAIIADYVGQRNLNCVTSEPGCLSIALDSGLRQSIILHAFCPDKIRGCSQGQSMNLDQLLPVPAVIHMSVSLGTPSPVTVTEYLMLYTGDDPVQLFLKTLERLVGQKFKQLNTNQVNALLLHE